MKPGNFLEMKWKQEISTLTKNKKKDVKEQN